MVIVGHLQHDSIAPFIRCLQVWSTYARDYSSKYSSWPTAPCHARWRCTTRPPSPPPCPQGFSSFTWASWSLASPSCIRRHTRSLRSRSGGLRCTRLFALRLIGFVAIANWRSSDKLQTYICCCQRIMHEWHSRDSSRLTTKLTQVRLLIFPRICM